MKVYSIFTVECQPEAFENHAKKFRLVHLRLFFRWLLTIFYHEIQITRKCSLETASAVEALFRILSHTRAMIS